MKRWNSIIFPVVGLTCNITAHHATSHVIVRLVFFHFVEKAWEFRGRQRIHLQASLLAKHTFGEKFSSFHLNFSETSHLVSQKAKADFPVRPLGAISPSTLPTNKFQIFHNKNLVYFQMVGPVGLKVDVSYLQMFLKSSFSYSEKISLRLHFW